MTGIPIVNDESELIAEPTANLDGGLGRLASEQNATSVYDKYWQVRSRFFNLAPKLTAGSIDLVRSNLP